MEDETGNIIEIRLLYSKKQSHFKNRDIFRLFSMYLRIHASIMVTCKKIPIKFAVMQDTYSHRNRNYANEIKLETYTAMSATTQTANLDYLHGVQSLSSLNSLKHVECFIFVRYFLNLHIKQFSGVH